MQVKSSSTSTNSMFYLLLCDRVHVNACLELVENESLHLLQLYMLAAAGGYSFLFLDKSPGDNVLID